MRTLLIVIAAFILGIAGYILSPMFGSLPHDEAVAQTVFRGVMALVLLPLGLFYAIHPTSQLNRRTKRLIDFFLCCGGLAGLGAVILIGRQNYLLGVLSILLSFVFLFIGRSFWLRTIPSPKQAIVEAGERILAEERDPVEKRKFASALDRFRKG